MGRRWLGGACTRRLLRGGLVVLAWCWAEDLHASYSGLFLIPTGEVTGSYTWVVDLQWEGTGAAFKTDQLLINTELGIGDRFEVGIDVNATSGPQDHRILLNAKYVFFASERKGLYLATGVQNVNENFTPYPYLVATKDWGVLRAHLGVQRDPSDRRTDWFVGVDRTFAGRWQFMADYTSGPENFASAGGAWIGKRWQVFLGAQWPNAGGPATAVIHVVLTGSYGGRKR